MTASLAVVGRIPVPSHAESHPFMLEARAMSRVVDDGRAENVIGTTNRGKVVGQRVELYGWGRCVAPHVDRTGWIYFAPLDLCVSVVGTPQRAVVLERGTVYRLDDHEIHWTVDDAPVVCAFVGPFPKPGKPGPVIRKMAAWVARLGDAKRRDAPRVSEGFRIPLRGEVWVDAGEGRELMLYREAKKIPGAVIARCALCPYCVDFNRCAKHLMEKAAP